MARRPVAGWVNEFIRMVAWEAGEWRDRAFGERALEAFLDKRINGEDVTKRKVLTNYRYMLASAGILIEGRLQPMEFRAPWAADATMLFWDRQIFAGELHRSSSANDFEAAFFREEIYKLPGCSSEQGRAIALSAYRAYSTELLSRRTRQIEELRGLLAA
jgi:hypothetical protein